MATTDDDLVRALRAGDERAFVELVDRHSAAMLVLARGFVSGHHVAEDVVQDTWLALLKGLDGFEGRSSLKTWLFTVLVNIAKSRGVRDRRTTAVGTLSDEDLGPTVPAERFRPAGDPWAGHWAHPPQSWESSPERRALSGEAIALVRSELARLPEQQRLVVSLRDVDGFTPAEVCALLDLTPANQRVLLHRGRARLRAALAGYVEAAS